MSSFDEGILLFQHTSQHSRTHHEGIQNRNRRQRCPHLNGALRWAPCTDPNTSLICYITTITLFACSKRAAVGRVRSDETICIRMLTVRLLMRRLRGGNQHRVLVWKAADVLPGATPRLFRGNAGVCGRCGMPVLLYQSPLQPDQPSAVPLSGHLMNIWKARRTYRQDFPGCSRVSIRGDRALLDRRRQGPPPPLRPAPAFSSHPGPIPHGRRRLGD